MLKVLITPRSFAAYSKEPLELLKKNEIEIITNPTKGILDEAQMMKLMADVDGVIVGVDSLNNAVLEKAKKLCAIAKYGVGVDNIDLDYCKTHNIDVSITKNANSAAVADYAFSLMLAVARRLVEIDNACHENDWAKRTGIDLYGKKIGILGLGAIGKGLVARAKGFEMEIYGYDVFQDEEYIRLNNIHFTSIEDIFTNCDFISVHLPLTEDTKHIINEALLSCAKENLVIVNTARGGIIDETALYEALKRGKIYGAGLDVFEQEPPGESPLLSLKNVVVGSHSAASTVGAVDKMSIMAAENLIQSFRQANKL